MKIKYSITKLNSNIRTKVDFEIVDIISKEQFKNLMSYSKYNKFKKNGEAIFDVAAHAEKFAAYIDTINQDSSEYKIEYKAKKEVRNNSKMSFEDYCSDYLDLDLALMSDEQKNQAHISYNKMK